MKTCKAALLCELATGRPLHGTVIGAAAGDWLFDRHEKTQTQ